MQHDMKHITLLSAAVLALAVSCNNYVEEDVLKTETTEFSRETPLMEDAPFTFCLDITAEWPTGGMDADAMKKMQKGITGLLFGSDLKTIDIEYAMERYNAEAVSFYISENEEMAEDIEDDWGFMLNWSESIEGSFLPKYNGMVSYIRYIYGYSGGAHGMDAKTAVTFSLSTGEEVTESDLFIEGYENKLTEALRRNLLVSIPDQSMLFETEIFPGGDFYLTSEGITYIYQRYEVGPYVIGIVEVTVPWNEIKDILKAK